MATLLGKLEEFDKSKEEWTQYVERMNHFFAANDIKDAGKKKSVFLAVVGPTTYSLLRNLVAPSKPGDKTFDELTTALKEHYNPTPSETVQRSKFHSRVRRQGESVAEFVAELRSLAEFCNFGTSLNDMLRDRLVCGINSSKIQQRLLAEKDLTLDKAVDLALGMETATKNVKELAQAGGSETTTVRAEVNQVNTRPRRPRTQKPRFTGTCFCCGKTGHKKEDCRHKESVCHNCHVKGHLRKMCGSQRPKRKRVHKVQEEAHESAEEDEYELWAIRSSNKSKPYSTKLDVDGKPLKMEVDTGASLTLVSEQTFHSHWPDTRLAESRIKLSSYGGESIPVLGTIDVLVKYGNQETTIPLLVVKGEGPSLLGRNWLEKIQLNWYEIFWLHNATLNELLEKHRAVFGSDLGTAKGFKAKIIVESSASPKFLRARSLPYFFREKVEAELEKLVADGTLEPVEHSEWAAPIVAVLKPDKQRVRICGDFKQTVNPVAQLDKYPIPRIEDLFSKLAGGQAFTKLDLSQAYLQLPLEDDSKQYVVINTHKGLFRYNRLPYGISSAPGIFQRYMERVLQGIPNVIVYLDDILVTGKTESEHLNTLSQVLARLEKAGLRAHKSKCKFMAKSVVFLGHMIDKHGVHPVKEKVQAIRDAPVPRNVSELKSYLGLLTYYSKFLPNMADVLAPLYTLLRKDTEWRWSKDEQKAFESSKSVLTTDTLLVHFNPDLPLTLMCDASSYGIGAVLAHRMPDDKERPIGYASRSLSKAERNYSQIEREALALVFGVKKFHSYLFGHCFELITDHKPLLALLHEHKPTSAQASARIRRWSLLLSAYEYKISFRKTEDHGNADALSRLPLKTTSLETPQPPELVLLMNHLGESPVTARHIRVWTRRDPILSKVKDYIERGWPTERDRELSDYRSKRTELSVYHGCILWGARVVVPPQGRKTVLQELHEGHPGMTRAKGLARMFVWWPGLESDIEQSVQQCAACQQQQPDPPLAPLQPWKWPSRPWVRLHMDFAGSFQGKMILIVIDSHSKWIEAFPTNSSTSSTVIHLSRTLFSQFGLPEVLVTDNGSCFVSEEFETFLLSNGVKHITSAPYHPATNGLAERAVQIVKKGLKKETVGTMEERLAKVLMAYRTTPQSTTGVTPAELLQGRRIRTRLDMLKPSLEEQVEQKQSRQKSNHDSNRTTAFLKGERVYARGFGTGPKWVPATIDEVSGPVSYLVRLEDDRVVRRHQDHLRRRSQPPNRESVTPDSESDFDIFADLTLDQAPNTSLNDDAQTSNGSGPSQPPGSNTSGSIAPPEGTSQSQKTYPSRTRHRPDYYTT